MEDYQPLCSATDSRSRLTVVHYYTLSDPSGSSELGGLGSFRSSPTFCSHRLAIIPFQLEPFPAALAPTLQWSEEHRARCISNTFWPETFLFQSQPVHLLSSSYSSACPQKLVQKPDSHRLSLLMHGPSVHSKVLFLFSWSQLTFIYFSVGLCPSFAASYLHCKS